MNEKLDQLVLGVRGAVAAGGGEQRVTNAVAAILRDALAGGLALSSPMCQPRPDHYVMHRVHVEPDESFSIASAVWGVGQETPIHDHGTWGVVGIYAGAEHETRYVKDKVGLLVATDESVWEPGEVTVCCTTDADIHLVRCAGDTPCVGIHIYGADIGSIWRHRFELDGTSEPFRSQWPTV